MSDKTKGKEEKGMSRALLELTQRLQLYMLQADIPDEMIHIWNGAKKEQLLPDLKKYFGSLPGSMEIKPKEQFIIDCDVDPFRPADWTVIKHKAGGQLEWNAAKIVLHLVGSQKSAEGINGRSLSKELSDLHVLNANVLDFLLANPHLIPSEWKGKYVFFWGTIYRDLNGRLCVRCLYWGSPWIWHVGWLSNKWTANWPAACLTK